MRRTNRVATVVFGFALTLVGGTIAGGDTSSPFGETPSQFGDTSSQFGDPLPGLSTAELEAFETGKEDFEEVETVADGLGPVFNERSCATCHSDPVVGGGSTRLETRIATKTNGVFDPLVHRGGSLLQDQGIGVVNGFTFQGEVVPPEATIVARRRTTPLFGLGLVDAVPDATFQGIARLQARLSPQTAGRPNMVTNLTTGGLSVGKFGWKAQVPTLFQFSGDAYLNEMGITNPQFPNENCPQGNCAALEFNPAKGVNDPEGEGVQAFTDFMTLLAPPPRGPNSPNVVVGGVIFAALGCANCHVPVLQTGPHEIRALANRTFFPFSDFLLHDMGSLGDGIEQQGRATGREMRTAPLWGLREIKTFLHDGRATTVEQAILAHEGQGAAARDRFSALNSDSKAKLLQFLNSL